MPGLIGILSNKRVDDSLLDMMANSIKYEDWYRVDKYSDSFFSAARVSLGIFNPESQPIFNEDRTICIFMYGKIYDYESKVNNLHAFKWFLRHCVLSSVISVASPPQEEE